MQGLPTLRDTCVPREEVLSGELNDEMFAARLTDVVQGKAHPIYQNSDLFFANTHPTERMQSFLNEVMGRLSGSDPGASALFRLDTPFGGGKTHTLIALYHLVASSMTPETVLRLGVDSNILPTEKVQVVSVVGDDLDPTNGVDKEGLKVYHLWGEIACQLGGPAGYALVERSDVEGKAPGPQFLDRLIGTKPTLLLIDEPALYMRKMGGSAGQLPAFLKTLCDWVATPSNRTVLVLTLAWDPEQQGSAAQDAFGRETLEIAQGVFGEMGSVIGRDVKVVTPAERQDIAPILRQRLFQRVDLESAPTVADAYFDALRQAQQQGVPIPTAAAQASFREALVNSYPFHPTLIEVLDGKLATVPNFQKTRGVLRLLARVVRRQWSKSGNNDALFHTFSLDLADPDLVDEITGRLDRPAFRPVVTYDVASAQGDAHSQVIDQQQFVGHSPYAQQIATTIFLHSLPEPPSRGVDIDELMAATITPLTDPAHLQKALEYLQDEAWHLDYEGRRYFFRTEPSLNKIVLDETNTIPLHQARTEAERRIKQLWRNAGLTVKHFPNEPSELHDVVEGRLVLMHWDTATYRSADGGVPAPVRELWEYTGVQREFRNFRNTLFFLVADSDRQESMVRQARRWLALDGLLRNTDRLDEYKLGHDHRQRLQTWKGESEIQVRLAITRAYRHLFYPVGDAAEASYRPFNYQALQIEEQGDARTNPTEVVLNSLQELGKVKSADDGPLAAALVKRDTFDHGEGSVPLQTLFERFAERVRLPLLLEPTYLKEVVRFGIQNRQWLYYDRGGNLAYDADEPPADVVIDKDHAVITIEAAQAEQIPVYRKLTPPTTPQDNQQRDGSGISDGQGTYTITREVKGEGEPRRALADLAALAKDAQWTALASVSLEWQADGRDAQPRLSAIRTILGQLSGAKAVVDIKLTCQFPDGADWQTEFRGPAERYQQLAPTLETLAGQCQDAHAEASLQLEFPRGLALDGPGIGDLRDVLDLAGLGHTRVTAQPLEGGA